MLFEVCVYVHVRQSLWLLSLFACPGSISEARRVHGTHSNRALSMIISARPSSRRLLHHPYKTRRCPRPLPMMRCLFLPQQRQSIPFIRLHPIHSHLWKQRLGQFKTLRWCCVRVRACMVVCVRRCASAWHACTSAGVRQCECYII